MAVTKTQFRAVFGPTTDAQFDKLQEWMDAVHPKHDANGAQIPNTLDDLCVYERRELEAKYKHWKADQATVEF